MPGAACPHCHRAIEPPPKRSRLCPHCRASIVVRRGELLTKGQAEAFDAELDAIASGKKMTWSAKRYRQFRAYTARDLKRAKRDGVTSGFEILLSGDECDICLALRGIVFPLESCTLDMLPPYKNCEYEDGCSACITEVLKPEYTALGRPVKRAAAKSGGLAGCLMVASILIGTFIVVGACYRALTGK